jgi:hypothetical protein
LLTAWELDAAKLQIGFGADYEEGSGLGKAMKSL